MAAPGPELRSTAARRCSPAETGTFTTSSTQSGYVVGAGYEWMIAPNWSLRGEYLYYGFTSNLNSGALVIPGVRYDRQRQRQQVQHLGGSPRPRLQVRLVAALIRAKLQTFSSTAYSKSRGSSPGLFVARFDQGFERAAASAIAASAAASRGKSAATQAASAAASA